MNNKTSEVEKDPNELVQVYNKGDGHWVHGDYKLLPNGEAEVPRFVAELWSSSYRSPVVMQKPTSSSRVADAKILAELETQKQENLDLQKRIENLEKLLNKVQTEPSGAPQTIKEKLKSTPTKQ